MTTSSADPLPNRDLAHFGATLMHSNQPMQCVKGRDALPGGPDAVNTALCRLQEPVEALRVRLVRAGETVFEDRVALEAPTAQITLPGGAPAFAPAPSDVEVGPVERYVLAVTPAGKEIGLFGGTLWLFDEPETAEPAAVAELARRLGRDPASLRVLSCHPSLWERERFGRPEPGRITGGLGDSPVQGFRLVIEDAFDLRHVLHAEQGASGAAYCGRLLCSGTYLPPASGPGEGLRGCMTYHSGLDDVSASGHGDFAATGTSQGTVIVWHLATGRPAARLVVASEPIRRRRSVSAAPLLVCATAFAPDGGSIAAANAFGTIAIWSWPMVEPRGVLDARIERGALRAIAWSPDGAYLAASGDDGAIQLWEVGADRRIGAPQIHEGRVYALRFAPDGATVASAGDDGAVVLSEPGSGRIQHRLAHDSSPVDVTFDPAGRVLAVGGADGSVHRWDPATGRRIDLRPGRDDTAGMRVAFHPDGSLLAAGGVLSADDRQGAVTVFNVDTGARLVGPFCDYASQVTGLAVGGNGRWLVSSDATGFLLSWDVDAVSATHRQA